MNKLTTKGSDNVAHVKAAKKNRIARSKLKEGLLRHFWKANQLKKALQIHMDLAICNST